MNERVELGLQSLNAVEMGGNDLDGGNVSHLVTIERFYDRGEERRGHKVKGEVTGEKLFASIEWEGGFKNAVQKRLTIEPVSRDNR